MNLDRPCLPDSNISPLSSFHHIRLEWYRVIPQRDRDLTTQNPQYPILAALSSSSSPSFQRFFSQLPPYTISPQPTSPYRRHTSPTGMATRHIQVFLTLTILCFWVLSHQMPNFQTQSYIPWAKGRGIQLPLSVVGHTGIFGSDGTQLHI